MSFDLATFPTQVLNGLSYAALLFVVAAGFTVVFGVMRVLNFAHGALFMLGAFVTYEAQSRGWGFLLAAAAAVVVCSLVAAALEVTLIARLYQRDHLEQVLLTLGVSLVVADVVLRNWGGTPQRVSPPELLDGTTEVFSNPYPTYRLAVIGFGVVAAVLLEVLLQRTAFGARLRAAVVDAGMASAVGINTRAMFTAVFTMSGALVGLTSAIGGPILGASVGMDQPLLIDALIVVVIGGPGSITGALVGALFLGFSNTMGLVFLPDYSAFVVYTLMAVVLLVRPNGLFGRPQVVRL